MANILRLFIISLSILALSSCSGDEDGNSSKVSIELVEDSPLIILGDKKFNPGADTEFTAAAPWFFLSFTVTNNSDEILYLLTMQLEITAKKNGQTVSQTTTLDTSQFCQSGSNRVYLGIIQPGETFHGMTTCSDDAGDKIATTDKAEVWTVHSLPEADSISYSVVLKPIGYFQPTATSPASGRYVDYVFFITQ